MDNPEKLRVLCTEIQTDLQATQRFAAELAQARVCLSGNPSQAELAFIGYLLHGLYTGWESAFKRIATTFENRLDPAERHAQLIRRMFLAIPGVRPAVLDKSLRLHLERLRSFRHFFRHNYQAELLVPEMRLTLDHYDAAAPGVEQGLRQFLVAVEQMAKELEKPQ